MDVAQTILIQFFIDLDKITNNPRKPFIFNGLNFKFITGSRDFVVPPLKNS